MTEATPLTVAQLIEKLSQYPGETRVLMQAYEFGYQDPIIEDPQLIELDAYGDADHGGPHAKPGEGWETPSGTLKAVLISRY